MNIFTSIKSHPYISSAVATVLAVATIAGGAFAWGPDRQLFTSANPADFVTFNSITDNPAHGYEPNFFQVKPADASDSAYSDKIKLEPGKEYEGYVYYHNNAAANLNLVAKDTTMRVELPAVVDGTATTNAYVSASNATPREVFDDATLTSSSAVALRMVPGSAKIHSHGAVDGQKLSDSLITSGVKLGYDKLDGKVPGCDEFAGYVTFRFVADQPNFTVEKEVSKHGANKWGESYKAQPGETVDFLLQYKNTGSTVQNDVVIKDELPKGMSYVPGSAKLGNPSHPQGVKTNDGVTTTGLNVGSYNPGQNAWIIFSAKVAAKNELECGTNTMTNKQIVKTKNGSKSDTAKVVVDKECKDKPEPKKIQVCDTTTNTIITIREDEFNGDIHTKDLAKCESIEACDIENGTIVTIDRSTYEDNRDRYTTDLTKCEDEPTVPAELPKTGLTSSLMSLLGLGALSYTTALYFSSRNRL